MRRRKRRDGFTLVELMVVAIIVAILAAIAIPLLSGNKERTMASEGQAGCGIVRSALRAYHDEHGSWPAAADDVVAALDDINDGDLDGVYFDDDSYSFTAGPNYVITATGKTGSDAEGKTVILSADGNWSGTLL
jgi:general secretion pathway protein G